MSHVIREIDDKHVAMGCPKNTELPYHNYEIFFTQVLLAICDAKYPFIFINAEQQKSTNDISILRNSELGRYLELYSINIPSEDTADGNCFKDGEPFTLPITW